MIFNKIRALNTYVVTSFFDFILVKEVNEKQVCYKHHFVADSVSCPENVDVFCHFANAANNSVQSPSMKLNLVPGESTFNYFKMLLRSFFALLVISLVPDFTLSIPALTACEAF